MGSPLNNPDSRRATALRLVGAQAKKRVVKASGGRAPKKAKTAAGTKKVPPKKRAAPAKKKAPPAKKKAKPTKADKATAPNNKKKTGSKK